MLARFVKGALFTGAFALVPCAGTAFAQPPPVAATASAAPAPVAPRPAAAARGAIVVALSDDAGPAARALAHEVYRDPALRPAIDEATARVLTGDVAKAPADPAATPPQPAAPTDKIGEVAALRSSIAASTMDITTRHLLASLGSSLRADLVVAVSLDGGHAMAKVLHAGTASYERVELGASVETGADGARSFLWPGAAVALRGMLPAPPAPPPAAEPPKPAAKPVEPPKPAPKAALSDQRPVWKSPWFWAALGGVTAVGVTVFVLSKTSSGATTIHLDGSVAP